MNFRKMSITRGPVVVADEACGPTCGAWAASPLAVPQAAVAGLAESLAELRWVEFDPVECG